MQGCSNTFSLLVRGFLWGHKACGFALIRAGFGAKAGLSFSGVHGTGAKGAADEQAASGCLGQSSPRTGRRKERGAASGSSQGWPGNSWESLTPSKARSMAAVSSFLHLLSFSDIFPKSDHVFYYVIRWKCTEQHENNAMARLQTTPKWGICHDFLELDHATGREAGDPILPEFSPCGRQEPAILQKPGDTRPRPCPASPLGPSSRSPSALKPPYPVPRTAPGPRSLVLNETAWPHRSHQRPRPHQPTVTAPSARASCRPAAPTATQVKGQKKKKSGLVFKPTWRGNTGSRTEAVET